MAKQAESIITNLVSEISKSVDTFGAAIPAIQRQMLAEVELLVKTLDISGSNIVANAKNLRIVGEIQAKLERIVKSPEYKAAVTNYAKSFKTVGGLQDKYFGAVEKGYKQPAMVKEIQNQSIDSALNSLLESGVSANVTNKIKDILRVNITTGASYSDLAQQLRDFITTNKVGDGALERYTKQITTDALNQYSAQYSSAVSSDLGFEWFRYTGAEIETTRPFCAAMIDKKFFHISEVPDLVIGNFEEFTANDGTLNSEGAPDGMVKGENEGNFFVYRGGYNCGHQIVGVPTESVPKEYRDNITQQAAPAVNPALVIKDPNSEKAKIMLKDWARNLEGNTRFAFKVYTWDSFELNRKLREGKPPSEYELNQIDMLMDGLMSAPKFSGVTYRGLHFDEKAKYAAFKSQVESSGIGGLYIERGFGSTSLSQAFVERTFAGEVYDDGDYTVMIKINGQTGVPITAVSSFEDQEEVLFAKGTKYKINSISESILGKKTRLNITLTEL